jgi:sugar/nucleoside kinase (ribokinase family)
LDIQGFVRQKKSNKFGAKRFCDEITGIIDKIDILKCNSKEFKFLPEKVIEKAKEKILIETKGAKGVRLWKEGSRLDFKPKKIIKTENAIGAGDTFMAAFVYKLINTKDIEKSILFALDYASSYLAEINRT